MFRRILIKMLIMFFPGWWDLEVFLLHDFLYLSISMYGTKKSLVIFIKKTKEKKKNKLTWKLGSTYEKDGGGHIFIFFSYGSGLVGSASATPSTWLVGDSCTFKTSECLCLSVSSHKKSALCLSLVKPTQRVQPRLSHRW